MRVILQLCYKSKKRLTYGLHKYIIIMGYKSEVIILSPRTGRPTNNRKGQPIHVRLDDTSVEILEKYTLQEKVSRAEAIRRGISMLASKLKK